MADSVFIFFSRISVASLIQGIYLKREYTMTALWILLAACVGLVIYGRERGGPIEVVVGLIGFVIIATTMLIGTAEKLGFH